jgi:putative ABC transport system permease protein
VSTPRSWHRRFTVRLSHQFIQLAALFVPRHRRVDWQREWLAELWQLDNQPRSSTNRDKRSTLGPVAFSLGVIAHVRWERNRRNQVSADNAGKPRGAASAVDSVLKDIKYAFRGLVRRPGFTAVALLTVALGIGANTAIFSLVNGVVFKPLPFEDPGRLVRVWPDQLFTSNGLATYLHDNNTIFEPAAMWGRGLFLLTGGREPREYRGAYVSTDHFDMLGVEPLLGRGFLPDEETAGADRVLILSHEVWSFHFGADPSAVGRDVSVAGTPYTIVGVLGPEHQPMESDWKIWAPINVDADSWQRQMGSNINGRLRPGVTVESATNEIQRMVLEYSDLRGWGMSAADAEAVRVVSLEEWLVGDIGAGLLLLLGAVGLVLLMACANVANLLLAVGGGRAKEVAVRFALGARRGRVIRLFLTESAMLGLGGGLIGVGAAAAVFRLAVSHLPPQIPRSHTLAVDATVLGFGLSLSLLAAILFGVAPALRATSHDLASHLKSSGPGAGVSRSRFRLNRGLVATEVALSVMLTVAAVLMVRSFSQLRSVDPGFAPEQVVTMRARLFGPRYSDSETVLQYHRDVHATLAATPGVVDVGGISILPMTPGGNNTNCMAADRPLPPEGQEPGCGYRVVSPGYREAMGISLVAGRDFDAGDRADGIPVAMINETLAGATWPGEDPVGRQLKLSRTATGLTVIGVLGDVRQSNLKTSVTAQVYVPFEQAPANRFQYAVKVQGDPRAMLGRVQDAFKSVDGSLPLVQVGTVSDVVGNSMADTRFFTAILAVFGVLALTLGAVGVYGVMSYIVSQEIREVGIRVALGAEDTRVLRDVLGKGLIPVILGLVVGLSGAVAGSRIMSGLLFEVSTIDPVTFVSAPSLLLLVAVVAMYIPARRASRVDPIQVLKAE